MATEAFNKYNTFNFKGFDQTQGDILTIQINFDLSILVILKHDEDNFYHLYCYKENKLIKFEKYVSKIDFAFMKTTNQHVFISNNQIEIRNQEWKQKQILGQFNFPKYYHQSQSILINQKDDFIIFFCDEGLRLWSLNNNIWQFKRQINLSFSHKIECSLSPSGKYFVTCQGIHQNFYQKLNNLFYIQKNKIWLNTSISKIRNGCKVELLGENLVGIARNVFTPYYIYELNYQSKKIISKSDLKLTHTDNIIFCVQKQLLYVYQQKKLYIYSKYGKNHFQRIQKLRFEAKIRYLHLNQEGTSFLCFFDHKIVQFKQEL